MKLLIDDLHEESFFYTFKCISLCGNRGIIVASKNTSLHLFCTYCFDEEGKQPNLELKPVAKSEGLVINFVSVMN